MTFDYVRSSATAHRLITRFGWAAILRRIANSGDGWNPAQSNTDYTVTCAVMQYATREIDGTLVQAGDRRIIISPNGLEIEPTTRDKLIVGGETYQILRVEKMAPAGTAVYYEAQCRA